MHPITPHFSDIRILSFSFYSTRTPHSPPIFDLPRSLRFFTRFLFVTRLHSHTHTLSLSLSLSVFPDNRYRSRALVNHRRISFSGVQVRKQLRLEPKGSVWLREIVKYFSSLRRYPSGLCRTSIFHHSSFRESNAKGNACNK